MRMIYQSMPTELRYDEPIRARLNSYAAVFTGKEKINQQMLKDIRYVAGLHYSIVSNKACNFTQSISVENAEK